MSKPSSLGFTHICTNSRTFVYFIIDKHCANLKSHRQQWRRERQMNGDLHLLESRTWASKNPYIKSTTSMKRHRFSHVAVNTQQVNRWKRQTWGGSCQPKKAMWVLYCLCFVSIIKMTHFGPPWDARGCPQSDYCLGPICWLHLIITQNHR